MHVDKELKQDEVQIPYISAELMLFLEKTFNISYLLNKDIKGSEAMKLGYIKGIQEVIDTLQACQKENLGR